MNSKKPQSCPEIASVVNGNLCFRTSVWQRGNEDGVAPMHNVPAIMVFATAIILTVASIVQATVVITQIGQFSITLDDGMVSEFPAMLANEDENC
jgi:hypothetical protein